MVARLIIGAENLVRVQRVRIQVRTVILKVNVKVPDGHGVVHGVRMTVVRVGMTLMFRVLMVIHVNIPPVQMDVLGIIMVAHQDVHQQPACFVERARSPMKI